MSISDITNPGIISGVENPELRRDSEDVTSSPSLAGNYDWFSVSDGKALPISLQSQFGDTSTMDEMLSAMLGHLGFS